MLIDRDEVGVFTRPCVPRAERFAAAARVTTDISQVLPHLNAALRGAVYHPEASRPTWKGGGHNTTLHMFEIATSTVEDREEPVRELRDLIDLVNRTRQGRNEIEPDFETHHRPMPMAVYKLPPGTNCKACGEATCFTFALRVADPEPKGSEGLAAGGAD